MMVVFLLLAFLFVVVVAQGQPPIRCYDADRVLNITVSWTNPVTAKVVCSSPGNQFVKAYDTISDYWDGHLTGLATGESLSVTYQNHFGCFANVQVTVLTRVNPPLLEVLSFDRCGGANFCPQ